MPFRSENHKDLFTKGTSWKLEIDTNGYASFSGESIVTQISAGRCFQSIDDNFSPKVSLNFRPRIKVRLLEDGYICFLEMELIQYRISKINSWHPIQLNYSQIKSRLDKVLNWIDKASKKNNKYLWGGSLGPDFDCSGLVQTSFASQSIWLPRDAYQQEIFCQDIPVEINNLDNLRPGNLLFFGTKDKCDHVGIYRGQGYYWHSSGIENGWNGIASDNLQTSNENSIAAYYSSRLRGAGRVERCHDGTTLP